SLAALIYRETPKGTYWVHHMTATEKKSSSLLEAALDYAARGWLVVPLHDVAAGHCSCRNTECGTPGKHPRTKHGLKDGTVDAGMIRRWWKKWLNANIGVCTGPDSGIWMLGPDGEEGKAALSDLVRKYSGLPQTLTARSGSGGKHHCYRWPADGNICNRKNHC